MFLAGIGIKDPVGKAFLFASIGEAGEKAFPTGADGGNEQRMFGTQPEPLAGMNKGWQCRAV